MISAPTGLVRLRLCIPRGTLCFYPGAPGAHKPSEAAGAVGKQSALSEGVHQATAEPTQSQYRAKAPDIEERTLAEKSGFSSYTVHGACSF